MQPQQKPTPEDIGIEFLNHYYSQLSSNPEEIINFYDKECSFSHGKDGKKSKNKTYEDLKAMFNEEKYKDCKTHVIDATYQEIKGNYILIHAIGNTTMKNNNSYKFARTFVLFQISSSFYIINDILRYLDNVQKQTQQTSPQIQPQQTNKIQQNHQQEAYDLVDLEKSFKNQTFNEKIQPKKQVEKNNQNFTSKMTYSQHNSVAQQEKSESESDESNENNQDENEQSDEQDDEQDDEQNEDQDEDQDDEQNIQNENQHQEHQEKRGIPQYHNQNYYHQQYRNQQYPQFQQNQGLYNEKYQNQQRRPYKNHSRYQNFHHSNFQQHHNWDSRQQQNFDTNWRNTDRSYQKNRQSQKNYRVLGIIEKLKRNDLMEIFQEFGEISVLTIDYERKSADIAVKKPNSEKPIPSVLEKRGLTLTIKELSNIQKRNKYSFFSSKRK
ncbi:ras gtpase-activating protein-binding protein [Anaeramoeba ignava]|uniref:Ras gtpase-activating protein-binding protein n=1 Tax=Anaeramoeba ignava TaxID=1746090 RepID=A0A9Q0RA48_ANAIG|nr:ras gtpase-activating protein-binding protein [Anaeramoeba ignava]